MKNNILAIVLARGGSKRLKNKNIKKLKNKALINWTTSVAIRSNKFCNIIISSDSEKILKTVDLYNDKILTLKRPKKFSDDKSTSEIAILHALKWYEKKFSKIDYIALLQPTSPFRTLKTINKGIKEISNKKLNAVIAVKKISFKSVQEAPFYVINNSFCKEVKFTNSLKKLYKINGLFYLIKKNFFLKKNDFSPPYFKPIIINSKKENIDIDTIKDWNLAKKFI
jgi:CMP-N,N'-diacetyllegionaminic acid synthase